LLNETRSLIDARARRQWEALPSIFKVNASVLKSPDTTPFARDFLISIRLAHLHVLLLLNSLKMNAVYEPNERAAEIADEMLEHVVNAVLLRNRLTNSGTGLSWKVS